MHHCDSRGLYGLEPKFLRDPSLIETALRVAGRPPNAPCNHEKPYSEHQHNDKTPRHQQHCERQDLRLNGESRYEEI